MNASVAIQVLPTLPDKELVPVEIVKQCQYVACEAGAPGLMTYVKINFNPGPDGILTISDKIDKYTKKDGE